MLKKFGAKNTGKKTKLPYKAGQWVVHVNFGKGKIIKINGLNVTVLFFGEHNVQKTFPLHDLEKGQKLLLWENAVQRNNLRRP